MYRSGRFVPVFSEILATAVSLESVIAVSPPRFTIKSLRRHNEAASGEGVSTWIEDQAYFKMPDFWAQSLTSLMSDLIKLRNSSFLM